MLTDTNVYKNVADQVCLLVEPSLSSTYPAPHWLLTVAIFVLAGGELSRESNPCVTFHRPIELTLELTGCCARAHDVGITERECLHFEPSQAFPPSPRWNVTQARFFLAGWRTCCVWHGDTYQHQCLLELRLLCVLALSTALELSSITPLECHVCSWLAV